MKERDVWRTAKRYLSPFGSMKRIENKLEAGFPDVLYYVQHPVLKLEATGLMELKNVNEWPKRPETCIRIDHLTIDQITWAEEWKGQWVLLVRVEDNFFLFGRKGARAIFEVKYTQADFYAHALVSASGYFPTGNIIKCLIGKS